MLEKEQEGRPDGVTVRRAVLFSVGWTGMMIIKWFMWFVTYSFVGWFYESALCSVSGRRLVNRGFLTGPVCPVYGFGALAVIFALYGRITNIFLIFLAAAFLTCALEYVTSWLMEKLFDTRWWDYSGRRFNLNGRVSLAGALVFGGLSVLLVKLIHPFVISLTDRIPPNDLSFSAVVAFVLLACDTAVSVRHILVLNGRLREIQSAFNGFVAQRMKRAEELKNALEERFEQSEFYSERIQALIGRNRLHDTRLFRAFPRLRSLKYEDALKKLKESLQSFRDRLPPG